MARVLVVDDARVARVLIREVLEGAGHQVIEAGGAEAGLQAAVEQHPDCITADLLMPGLDGLALVDTLRARGVLAPVLVVTADIQKSTHEECLRRGATAVLGKPISAAALLKAVSDAIAGRSRPQARRLDEAQLDAIQEAINIGVGRAAAALNELVQHPVALSPPRVELLDGDELGRVFGPLGKTAVSSVQMSFHGALEGCAFLIFPQPSASRLLAGLTGDDVLGEDLDSLRSGTLTEIGNVLINSILGTLANLLDRPLRYSSPVYEEGSALALVTTEVHASAPLLLLVRTGFRIRGAEIEGSPLLLFELRSSDALVAAVQARPRPGP